MIALPTYFFRDENGVQKNLPMLVTNIADAAAHFDKLTESQKQWRIYERFPVISNNGDVQYRSVDVTAQCIDILWNYYEAN